MNTGLRIVMFGQKRIPSREGGIEIVVEELSTRMVKRGHKVTCYCRKGHHVSGSEFDSRSHTKYKGVVLKPVFTIDKKGVAAVTSAFFSALWSAFGNYDVVHIHAEGPAAFCWIPKLFGKRIIVSVHGLDWQREKWKSQAAAGFIRLGEHCAVNYADEIIVLSKNIQNYFYNTYRRDTVLIPNGVDTPKIVNADRIQKEYGLEKDGYILYLGRLVPEKGILYLIEAFKQIETTKKLVIAGGGSDTDNYVKELKQAGSKDQRVLFTGFVQGHLLEELYSNAYLYCLPSDLEGMPLSLLEAMSYGNCCVVSNIAECTEAVEDHAVVFQKGNIEDLASKLQKLCNHSELVNTYKKEAADFICGKYNWDDVVEQSLSLYGSKKKQQKAKG